MTMKTLFVVALLIAQALCVPFPKSFSADATITQADGSVAQVSWYYDARQQAERVVFHRAGEMQTVNIRLYAQGVEYLLIEQATDSCHMLPISGKAMPSPVKRSAIFAQDNAVVSWSNIVSGPVDASMFALPAACAPKAPLDGLFCPTCLSVGAQVISLGCNATGSEIANLCGNVFATVCKAILVQACDGACEIEDCTVDACCLVGLCSGDTCNSSSLAKESAKGASIVAVEDNVGAGIFCPSCLSVTESVISLGCNATAAEIANLCGNVFAGVCKTVLDTTCSGACTIEDCAAQSCCLFKLCSGATCTNDLDLAITAEVPATKMH